MGASIALNMFKDKMYTLLQSMIHVCVHMDDLVIISNDIFKNHMDVLDDVLLHLKNTRIHVNTVKLEWS